MGFTPLNADPKSKYHGMRQQVLFQRIVRPRPNSVAQTGPIGHWSRKLQSHLHGSLTP